MSSHRNDEPLTISREDLYELVWSKPMLELAKDFGMSDVALAKRCRRLGVPVPGRGYWARIDAGQMPHKPTLPKRTPQWGDHRALSVPNARTVADVDERPAGEPASSTENPRTPPSVPSFSACLESAMVDLPGSLEDALPAIKRTARLMKCAGSAGLKLERGQASGPVASIAVSGDSQTRALLLADFLLRAAAKLGWSFVSPTAAAVDEQRSSRRDTRDDPMATKTPFGHLLIEGEPIGFRIEERLRDEKVEPTPAELAREKREWGYRAPRRRSVPTGSLRIVRLDLYSSYGEPSRKTWYDRKGSLIELQLRDVLAGFRELSKLNAARRAEALRQERRRKEHEILLADLDARRNANDKLIKQLETDAGAWHRARYLRRYVRAAKRVALEKPIVVRFRATSVDFLAWAERYVDQLDPLHASPRNDELLPRSQNYYGVDSDHLNAAMKRLLGIDWKQAWKLGADYAPVSPPSASHTLFHDIEASVFETPPGIRSENA